MFTGLVQRVGSITSVSTSEAGARIDIDPGGWDHRPQAGASIAVNGCCLTVAEIAPDGTLSFDAIPETLSKTTLGSFEPSRRVNLEHSVTPSTLLGGHLVQGHVDGVARVVDVTIDDGWTVRFEPPGELMQFVSPKGSVTIDGVSLTVSGLDAGERWFEVSLIPTTLEETTLSELRKGSEVNLETDMLVRSLVHWVRNYGSG